MERQHQWETLFEGTELDVLSLRLPQPVTAQKVRLLITDRLQTGTDRFQGPGIQEFDLYLSKR